jgi:hypothetical protein
MSLAGSSDFYEFSRNISLADFEYCLNLFSGNRKPDFGKKSRLISDQYRNRGIAYATITENPADIARFVSVSITGNDLLTRLPTVGQGRPKASVAPCLCSTRFDNGAATPLICIRARNPCVLAARFKLLG